MVVVELRSQLVLLFSMATDSGPANCLINKCVTNSKIKGMWLDQANPTPQLPKQLGINVTQGWIQRVISP